jgi:3-oxoacyl-[acyl-carrier-protein] synthase III
MRLDDLFVAGIGSWLPPAVDVTEVIANGRYDPEEQAANEYLSITVAGDEAPPEMAVRAGRQALARSGVPSGDIAPLLHASLWYQGIDFWPAQREPRPRSWHPAGGAQVSASHASRVPAWLPLNQGQRFR